MTSASGNGSPNNSPRRRGDIRESEKMSKKLDKNNDKNNRNRQKSLPALYLGKITDGWTIGRTIGWIFVKKISLTLATQFMTVQTSNKGASGIK